MKATPEDTQNDEAIAYALQQELSRPARTSEGPAGLESSPQRPMSSASPENTGSVLSRHLAALKESASALRKWCVSLSILYGLSRYMLLGSRLARKILLISVAQLWIRLAVQAVIRRVREVFQSAEMRHCLSFRSSWAGRIEERIRRAQSRWAWVAYGRISADRLKA